MADVTETDIKIGDEIWRKARFADIEDTLETEGYLAEAHAVGRVFGWTQFASMRRFLVEEGDCDCNNCILEALAERDKENAVY